MYLRIQILHRNIWKANFMYMKGEEYLNLVIRCLENLDPEIVIHRMTGDGPEKLLLAPLWTGRKREVLNLLHHQMKVCDSWQESSSILCQNKKEVTEMAIHLQRTS